MSKKNNERLNLRRQIRDKLEEKTELGRSRHEAKKGLKKPTEAVGFLTSKRTIKEYKRVCMQWMDDAYENGQKMNGISLQSEKIKKSAVDFLQRKKDEGCSVWTIKAYRAGLNSVLDDKIIDTDIKLPKRLMANITRGRAEKSDEFKAKFKTELELAEATGARVSKCKTLKPRHFSYKNGRMFCTFHKDKGGKTRTVPVLQKYQASIEKMLKGKGEHDFLCSNYARKTHELTTHQCRRVYAVERYKEITEANGTSEKTITINGKKYDKVACEKVSENLGHNRLDVLRYYLF
jgi:integrase